MSAQIRDFIRKQRAIILISAGLAFILVNNLVWLARDTLPPAWDQAAHADHCLSYLRLLQNPMSISLTKLLTVSSYYPPFFYVSTLPVTMIFGFSCDALAAANILFLAVMASGLFMIGRRLFNEAAGIGAVVITLLFPIVFALSREVLLDAAILGMVTLALDRLDKNGFGTNLKSDVILGAAIGFAVLTKWTAIAFLPGPFLLVLIDSIRTEKLPFTRVLRSLATVGLVTSAVVLPWFLANSSGFFKSAANALGTDAVLQGDPSGLFESLAWYGKSLKNTMISVPVGIIVLAGLLAFGWKVRNRKALLFLFAWIVPAFVVFLIVPNKDARNLVPLLPALALAAAAGLDAIRPRAAQKALWGALILVGVIQFYSISFGWPVKSPHGYTHPPKAEKWKIEEILESLRAWAHGRELNIAVLPDLPYFNTSTFRFYAHLLRIPCRIDPIGTTPAAAADVARHDVIVSKTGLLAPRYSMLARKEFRNTYLQGSVKQRRPGFPFRPGRMFALPDQSKARIFVRISGK